MSEAGHRRQGAACRSRSTAGEELLVVRLRPVVEASRSATAAMRTPTFSPMQYIAPRDQTRVLLHLQAQQEWPLCDGSQKSSRFNA